MKKRNLIKTPELFQGQKLKNNTSNYFEGWYFKYTNGQYNISFIPGINISNGKEYAFIQVITNAKSYFIPFDFLDFKFNNNPFSIQIGKNYFSKEKIILNIRHFIEDKELKIFGEIEHSELTTIKTDKLNPNIMGPFSYIPFMECNHAIISMKHEATGSITINENDYIFSKGIGYIEKDWGYSFPKEYIWCQANNFEKSNTSLFFSVADIPFKILNFKGFICVLKLEEKEYKFTTYNFSKIKENIISNNAIDISLIKGNMELKIIAISIGKQELLAPNLGNMNTKINESVNAIVEIKLYQDGECIHTDISNNGGLELHFGDVHQSEVKRVKRLK